MLNKDEIESQQFSQNDGPPISLCWENLTVHTNRKRDSLVKNILKKIFEVSTINNGPSKVLDSVTGHGEGGNLVAIMGPSGSGKTTLLAALAKRVELSSGCIRINGCAVSRNAMSKIAGYMPQFYALPTALTAMEYMTFACTLKLDKRTSSKERNILANNIFAELGLLESSNTIITKLSGGEVKRLSLAVEMVTKPKILFLDEPTTGLDTWTAMRVIESAKAEATNGTLVLCSIHQPAMDIYKMFSHVIFLSNGRTAYYGTLKNATKFFNGEGFICPESFNEAEYYVKIVSSPNLVDSLNTTNSFLVSGHAAQICTSFSHSTYCKSLKTPGGKSTIELESYICKPNRFVQFYWLLWRILLEIRRTIVGNVTHHYTSLISAILVSVFYFGVDSRTQTGVQNMKGALYLISSEVIFSSAYSVVYVLPQQLPLYLRENSMYTPSVYYITTVIGLIPKTAFHCLVFILIMFFSLDVKTDFVTIIQFATYVVVSSIASSAYGIMISSWIENPNIATSIMGPIDLISYIMAGVFYNIRALPAYLNWLRYLSIFYYTNEALAIIHWTSIDYIECYPDKDLPCFKSGREVLTEYGYNENNLWLDASALILISLGFHFIGYFGVKRRRNVKAMY